MFYNRLFVSPLPSRLLSYWVSLVFFVSDHVESEQRKETERGAEGGSGVRNDEKAPCFEGRMGIEDSMDCGEGILKDTNATVDCQPLLRQPQEDVSTTTEKREEDGRGIGR